MRKIVIFGGSGFIGNVLTKLLLANSYEICVICTNLDKAKSKLGEHKNLTIKAIDIYLLEELEKLILNYDIIINLIGKLYETKNNDFKFFHEDFPRNLARLAGKKPIIHLSALAIEHSAKTSLYAKTKLAGENALKKYAKNYLIIKPSIVYGAEDNFFNLFAKIADYSPFLPLIGGGKTLFSPIYVADLAEAILFFIKENKIERQILAAHGNENISFRQILEFILKIKRKKRILVTLPFAVAKFEARIMNILKIYLLTSDQVELLKYDNIADHKYKNISITGIDLADYKKIVPTYLK